MRRLLLPALLVAALTACGSPEAPAVDPAAPVLGPTAAAQSGPTGGVPALTGDPADLTVPAQAEAGSGAPPTELLVEDVVIGSGTAATQADTVDVAYTGTLWDDGSVFDSSWERGGPTTFPLSGVVPGFSLGIEGMAPGGRRVIVMPPDLAYGDNPPPGLPPGATLVFVVDLVSIA